MNAELRYLESLLWSGVRPGLTRMREFLRAAGRPEKQVPSVIVAGTNGKGSTAATIASIAMEAGYRTALYTSPHLVSIRERWALDGEPVAMPELRRAVARLRELETEVGYAPTYFEALTLVAFILFAQTEREISVLEVGMGGRLDATNIVRPIASVITPIGLDHTEWLGTTLSAITREKAGVIHRGSVAVTSVRDERGLELIGRRAAKLDVPFHPLVRECRISRVRHSDEGVAFTLETPERRLRLTSPLRGAHQVDNVALAARTAELIAPKFPRIDAGTIRRGVANTRWRGRLERFEMGDATVWVDGAHNAHAAARVASFVGESLPRPRTLVFGVLRDKHFEEMAELLFPLFDRIVLTEPDSERALRVDEALATLAPRFPARFETAARPAAAIRRALASSSTVFICGSLYLAGEAIATLDRMGARG